MIRAARAKDLTRRAGALRHAGRFPAAFTFPYYCYHHHHVLLYERYAVVLAHLSNLGPRRKNSGDTGTHVHELVND